MVKNKTYHRRVFGGKEVPWRGIDQGKAPFTDGALQMALNASFDESVFKLRDGQESATQFGEGIIYSGHNSGMFVTVISGEEVFAEEVTR